MNMTERAWAVDGTNVVKLAYVHAVVLGKVIEAAVVYDTPMSRRAVSTAVLQFSCAYNEPEKLTGILYQNETDTG